MKCSCRFARSGNFAVTLVCSFFAAAGVALAASPSVKTSASAPVPKTRAALIGLPLSFEANLGQTDPSVKFLARGDGYALFLTADSAVFKLRASGNSTAAVVRMKLAGASAGATVSGGETLPGKVNYFIGNDPSTWSTGVNTYGRVRYQGIYPGIDLVYYGTQRQLEYDFVVAPGADPKRIALQFGDARPAIGADGSLVLTLDGTPLTFRRPVVYQTINRERKMIPVHYRLSGEQVQFVLGKYDHKRALVIDPVLSYLTYLGGSGTDYVGFTTYGGNPTQGMAVDQSGNVYVTGFTNSTDFPVQNSIQGTSTTNAFAGFVSKLNPTGSALVYSTYIGGDALSDGTSTRPYAIAVDSSGSAYVTGYTTAPQFPVTAGAYQTACGFVGTSGMSNCPGAQSAFLTKLSPSGSSLVYSTFLGRSNEIAVAVAVDAQGKAYVAGYSGDQCSALSGGNAVGPAVCFPTTANAVLPGSTFNVTLNPNNFNQGSAFISVFDAAGAHLLYSSLYGGTGNTAVGNGHPTFPAGVAVDGLGNFYLVGTTGSNEIPVTSGAFQAHYYGNPTPGFSTATRGFVAKFSPVTGAAAGATPVYSTYLGGTDPTQLAYQDFIAGIAADAAGNAFISGNASYNFPVTTGAYDTAPCATLCINRAFVAKLNPAGSALVWSTYLGDSSNPPNSAVDSISPPRLDAAGNVYVSGQAGDNTEVPLVNPLQPANHNGGVYVTKLNPTGSAVLFSTVIYQPSNGGILPGGVDVDPQGNIYVAGYGGATGLPVTAGAFQPTNAGGQDNFIAKMNLLLSASIGLVVAPSTANAGSPVTFTATVTGASGGPVPTGIVNFMIGSTMLGSGTLNGSGIATFISSAINGGNYSVTAVYVGDNIYSTVTSVSSSLTITGSLPCTYSYSSSGQAFPSTGGSGNIAITVAAGCPWTVGPLPPFATLTSSGSGSGNGTVTFTVSVNSGSDRSGSFTINGQTFTIQQEAASITGLNLIGSMPHLAAEENWLTTFTLVNKGAAAATARLSLFGDPADASGNGPLTLPLTFPQQASATGPILAASFDQTLAANASLIVTTAGPRTPPVQVGSAQLAATGPVDGFAIFHLIPGAQEAVVPMETRNASSYLLAFDNTGEVVLAVAVANVSAQAANIGIVIRDDTGTVIGTPGATLALGGNGHTAFVVPSQFPVTANKRGTIEFDTPAGGQISMLGIRTTPLTSTTNTLTTIPALANVGTGGGSFAFLASGGDGWQTTFVLVNAGSSAAPATLKFFDPNGNALSLPLSYPQSASGPITQASSVTQTISAGATLVVQSGGAPTLLTGSAQLTTSGNISGFVIFRYNPTGQEAVVPLESRNAAAYLLPFDNTTSTATGISVNNVAAPATFASPNAGPINTIAPQTVVVPVVVRDDMGNVLGQHTLTMAANGEFAGDLAQQSAALGAVLFPETANIRGTLEFDAPSGAQIGVIGIRTPPTNTYTTLPALVK